MLVLSRYKGQRILITEHDIAIEVCEILDGRVKLGITAPKSCRIMREELLLRNPSQKKDTRNENHQCRK